MTVCVSVKVSEGLVLAADSAAAVHGRVGEGERSVLKTYEHVRKLSQLKDYPIGVLTWGVMLIGARSVDSLIREFEYGLASVGEEEEKRRELRLAGVKEPEEFRWSVREMAEELRAHMQAYYEDELAGQPQEGRPFCGVLVSGYSSGKFFPEQWLFSLPAGDLTEVRRDVDGKPNFGANWYGLTDAITRLHWGRDDGAIDILAERFELPKEEIQTILRPLQYAIAFPGMPLQDAVDYAEYLVSVAIGRFRFVVGAPVVGGEIDVAVVTPDGFTWVRKKSLHG